MKNILHYLLGLAAFAALLISCEEDKFHRTSGVELEFSQDTVMFDTLFTTMGSITRELKVHNRGSKGIVIPEIRLANAGNTPFRLNIDGVAADQATDVELAAHDSMYIFVEATVDVTGEDLPVLVHDSIVFSFDDREQDVDLVAWGQDFHRLEGAITEDVIWTGNKPYVIADNVLIEEGVTLTVEEGARIYFYNRKGLYIKGTMSAEGTPEFPILFRGVRLEEDYEDLPDQWTGIVFYSGSTGNSVKHARIAGANIGLQVGTIEHEGGASLEISDSYVEHMGYSGILAMKSAIKAENCVVSDCGYYGVALLVGGEYEFMHTTIANFWSWSAHIRQTPSLIVSNQLTINNSEGQPVTYLGDLVKATFGNSIVYGNQNSEIELGESTEAAFNVLFDHCLLKTGSGFDISDTGRFKSIIENENPEFKDYSEYVFELDTLSPAKDMGLLQYANEVPVDLLGISRLNDDGPDLGAFERVEAD